MLHETLSSGPGRLREGVSCQQVLLVHSLVKAWMGGAGVYPLGDALTRSLIGVRLYGRKEAYGCPFVPILTKRMYAGRSVYKGGGGLLSFFLASL